MSGRMVVRRTHHSNLENSRGRREKKTKQVESHPAFLADSLENQHAQRILSAHTGYIVAKYRRLCLKHGAHCDDDHLQTCFLYCWRAMRGYDQSKGDPRQFLSRCVVRSLFSRFEYTIRRPVDNLLKINDYSMDAGYRQLCRVTESLHDFRWSTEEQAENADELSLIKANATADEMAYLLWYFARASHTGYDHATDPPPHPHPQGKKAPYYAGRKRMMIDRIRKRIGVLSPE